MKLNIDHHVHSKYSYCCKEDYDLADIIKNQISRGLKYICVSDHIHTADDNGGISRHFQLLKNNPDLIAGQEVFIGAELKFYSQAGDVPLPFKDEHDKPQFTITGCHFIPGYNLSMFAIRDAKDSIREFSDTQLLELYQVHQRMLISGINKMNFVILAHPLDIFIRCSVFDTRLLELFAEVAGMCRTHDIAVEINNASGKRCLYPVKESKQLNELCISSDDFYREMIKIAQNEKVLFSPASDAHRKNDIGKMDNVELIVLEMGINDGQILYLDQSN